MAASTAAASGMFLLPAARLPRASLHAGPHVPPPDRCGRVLCQRTESMSECTCLTVHVRMTGVPVMDGRSRRGKKQSCALRRRSGFHQRCSWNELWGKSAPTTVWSVDPPVDWEDSINRGASSGVHANVFIHLFIVCQLGFINNQLRPDLLGENVQLTGRRVTFHPLFKYI